MIDFKGKKILVLAPHTDDGELGCGATIDKAIKEGAEVFYTAFSVCEQSVPYGFAQDELQKELFNAMKILKVKEDNIFVFRIPVRRFDEYRQDILQSMIDIKNTIKPEIIFMPSLTDIHQDHACVAHEGLRAFKTNTILSYELPWNNLNFQTSSFIKVSKNNLEQKIKALAQYKTQNFRQYTNSEYLTSLSSTRGMQIGCEYAEAFEVVRIII